MKAIANSKKVFIDKCPISAYTVTYSGNDSSPTFQCATNAHPFFQNLSLLRAFKYPSLASERMDSICRIHTPRGMTTDVYCGIEDPRIILLDFLTASPLFEIEIESECECDVEQ